MATFSLSPSVDVTEKDLTLFTRTIVSYSGGIAGNFGWGPVEELKQITSGKTELARVFGKPNGTASNYIPFLMATSFMAYGLPLWVARVCGVLAKNAVSSGGVPVLVKNESHYDSVYPFTGTKYIAKYPGTLGNGIKVSICPSQEFDLWEYKDVFDYAPEDGEYNVVIVDTVGDISGSVGTILEKYELLQLDSTAVKPDGTTAYFKEALNKSAYIWVGDADSNDFGGITTIETTLAGGVDDFTGNEKIGYDLFANPEEVDIAFLISTFNATLTAGDLEGYVNDITTNRRDCISFRSPSMSAVVNNKGSEVADIAGEKNKSTSYGVMDCNWKYMYDEYNNINRWVPCAADTAGLLGRVYLLNEPWESPAGYNRGRIQNVIKLAWNPNKPQRDELYKSQVNPIISSKGDGVVLLGDKTMLARPSAFGYINVRSLFIILERSIADAAKYQLFDLNTPATQSQFRNQSNQFLRNIQGRGGILRYTVVADESNNTDQVMAEGRFVGQIAVKPARSINNIVLEFAAVGSDVQFDELEQAK